MYVVEHYGHPMAGRLGQPDVPRDNGLKHLSPEETSEVGSDLLREGRPVIVHGKEDPFDRERGVDCPADAHKCV
jgi:hypothetical protein